MKQDLMMAAAKKRIPKDEYWNNVESILEFEDNITDVKGSTWTGTPLSYATGQVGKAVVLDHTSNLTTSIDDWNNILTSQFTIEFWAKHNYSGLIAHFFYTPRVAGGFSTVGLWFNGTTLYLYSSSNGGGWDLASGIPIAIPAVNTWHHYAIVRSATTLKVFYDGAEAASYNYAGNYTGSYTIGPTIGPQTNANVGGTITIDSFRFTKGVARYTGTFTPNSRPHPTS